MGLPPDIDEARIMRVCADLQAAHKPLFGRRSFNRACSEAVALINHLSSALLIAKKHADEIERTALAELTRCLPGYVWPDAPRSDASQEPPPDDPLAILQAVALAREAEVTAQLDKSDRHLVETKRVLAPAIAKIKELESHIAGDDIQFSYGVAGHIATVTLISRVSHHRLTLTTDLSLRIMVEEFESFTYDSHGPYETNKTFDTADKAVAYIAEACGRRIGERSALKKRPPQAWQNM